MARYSWDSTWLESLAISAAKWSSKWFAEGSDCIHFLAFRIGAWVGPFFSERDDPSIAENSLSVVHICNQCVLPVSRHCDVRRRDVDDEAKNPTFTAGSKFFDLDQPWPIRLNVENDDESYCSESLGVLWPDHCVHVAGHLRAAQGYAGLHGPATAT